MTPNEATRKAYAVIIHLEQAAMMLADLRGEKTERLLHYQQAHIDILIDNILDDFLVPAINSVKGEF